MDPAETFAPLDGVRVVDLSSGVAGAYCTKLLADGGADVVKIESAAGDPLRRRSWFSGDVPDGDDGALFQYLSSSKRSVVVARESPEDLALAHALVDGAAVVVWSPGSDLARAPEFTPVSLRTRAPRAVVVSITNFGLEGPWSGRAASDLTLQAWAGGPALRGLPDTAPLSAGGEPAAWLGGMFGALAALTSLSRGSEAGDGELVDVSILEALALSQYPYQVTFRSIAGRPQFPGRFVTVPGIEPTADGYVGFMVATAAQWEHFCAMLGREDWLEDPSLLSHKGRSDRRIDLQSVIHEFTMKRSTEELLELASAVRVPCAPIGNGASIPGFAQFAESDTWFRRNPRGGFVEPGRPFRLVGSRSHPAPTAAPRLGEHTAELRDPPVGDVPARGRSAEPPTVGPRQLEGLRIADFTAYWAGPFVGQFLGMFGADVIHVESIQRPDGFRGNTSLTAADDEWWEWSAYFQGSNAGKRGITLDLSRREGQQLALRLVEHCDIVLDNFTPRVMEGWGLSYENLREVRPDLIMVRMPAFGSIGPWRNFVGYAPTIEQVSGMAWMTGFEGGSPVAPNGACDPIGGAHAAIAVLLALEHRRKTGEGALVDASMAGAALNVAAQQLVEYSAYGNLAGRIGNRGPSAAPQGFYLTADVDEAGRADTWIAVAVETDEQFEALRTAMGEPRWSDDSSLATVAGRRHAFEFLDRHLAAWCAERSLDELVETLWGAGVPVGAVVEPHAVDGLPQMTARRFYETVEHPVTGPTIYPTFPARFEKAPAHLHRAPAPTLGQHNFEVLHDLLGLSTEAIAELERDQVIGTRPVGSQQTR